MTPAGSDRDTDAGVDHSIAQTEGTTSLSADAPTTSLCSEGWTCESTDSAGIVYDGSNGWQVTDSYSCGSGECGGYGVDHSIAQTEGTTVLRASDFEVADSTGRLGGPVDIGKQDGKCSAS